MKLYKKGAKFEYKVREIYRKLGYEVIRSAGSRGPFDLIAINPETKQIRLIQCKAGYLSKNQKQAILEPLLAFEGQYSVDISLATPQTPS